MKKAFLYIIAIVVIVLAGCGESKTTGGNSDSPKKEKTSETKLLTKEEFEKMYSDPKKYKGSTVDFYAKVFVEPERDGDGTYLQAYANNNDERNTIIGIEDPDFDIAEGDIIHVKGKIKDVFEGENAFGAQITAPAILADTIEKADYQTAFSPTEETIELNEEQNQHGYKLEVQKVELAEKETRVYVKVSNEMDDKISFYSFNAKLTTDGKQYEEEMNYDADYPEVQSDILPGVDTEGIIAFPAIPEEAEQFKLYFEGSSENWEIDIKPFVFEVKK
ncbi:DUF4352 domain-containing protein [Siminovitchia acidinfaciens]|uniref:DUF4352 domain-containing protein n=1 Tax=Siminovitchia acidinfaciens TaxID=2321395 RepID=A0A429XUW3_9BACI|nr:DUF4352 domain-containing protein [Siminovitchia acidinfaciens]RST71981.1 DUF4352 domain-containing protein [Siminovitchia acidinfaciens]